MDIFLMSIAACSTFYARGFAEQRGLSTEGMAASMDCEYDSEANHYTDLSLTLTLPAEFPEKYVNAIAKAMETCTVKKHITNPPAFRNIAKRA